MLSNSVLLLYYTIVTVIYAWFLYRYRNNAFVWLIITLFFAGPFAYFIPKGPQLLRLVTFVWTVYLFFNLRLWKYFAVHKWMSWFFAVFSCYFIIDTLFVIQDGLIDVFSQYSKYFIPFICLLAFWYYGAKDVRYMDYFNRLFFQLIFVQILVTILKLLLLRGQWWEGMVGTFGGVRGGGAGTGFPLVALAWVAINTNMEIKKWRSWLFIVGLLLIGIMTGKRAVIFLFPLFFFILGIWVARRKYPKQVIYLLCLSPLFLYFGLRLTPSLNPENKRWGSFDPSYAWNYAMDYSMGKEDEYGARQLGDGRVGANALLWKMITDTDHYTVYSWRGYGVERIYSSADSEQYRDRDYNFGVDHRGSLTGVFMLYIAIGLIGTVLFMLYYFSLFQIISYIRLRYVLWGMVMFDFIFYNTTTIREPPLAILMMFVIVYSYLQYNKKGIFIGNKINI